MQYQYAGLGEWPADCKGLEGYLPRATGTVSTDCLLNTSAFVVSRVNFPSCKICLLKTSKGKELSVMENSDQKLRVVISEPSTGGSAHRHSGRVGQREQSSSISSRQWGGLKLLENYWKDKLSRAGIRSSRAQGRSSPRGHRCKGTRERGTRFRVTRDLLDFWLAGGEGKTIFGAARKKLAEHRRKHHERRPVLTQGF
jgi:hypothetical protein